MTAFMSGSSGISKTYSARYDARAMAAAEATLALSSSDLTASAAYALAINLADDRSSFCRELAAALFSRLQTSTNGLQTTSTRSRHKAVTTQLERLCVLAADGECSQLRRRALSLLPALPLVPKELVNRAIDKVAAASKAKQRQPQAPRRAAAALDNDEMYDLDELCVVGWRSDAKRQADEAAKAARERAGAGFPDPPPDDRATLAEASAGCVQLGLEDDSKHVRLAAINALTDLIWPHGPSQPAVTAGGRAVGLLIACCADQTAEVRKAALDGWSSLVQSCASRRRMSCQSARMRASGLIRAVLWSRSSCSRVYSSMIKRVWTRCTMASPDASARMLAMKRC